MSSDLANVKQQLHGLVDRLAARSSACRGGLLRAISDPVSRAVADAPVDYQALTEEETQALAEAREWLKHNKPIPHEQVLARLGITQEEIENYKEPA